MESSFVPTAQVQAQLAFNTPDGTTGFLRRQGLKPIRVGRRLLWRAVDVRSLMDKLERGPRRMAPVARK